MTEDQVKAAVQHAIEQVRREEPPLLFERAHERSIAHRLAVHMEPHFRHEWNVDCEYDRDGQVKKTLENIAECDRRKATDEILPDIIVHHREREGRANNLLVVEIKKNAETNPCDHRKLQLMTDPRGHYQYTFGLYINVNGGEFRCTWYQDGHPSE